MIEWISVRSEDTCEWLLTSAENVDRDPTLMFDTDGKLMTIVKRFEAATYDQAKVVHEKLMADVREELSMNIRTEQDLADHIINQLNEIARTDPTAMEWLIANRITCNEALANHPTVQVLAPPGEKPKVGMLGIINGIVGAISNEPLKGYGYIGIILEDDGSFVKFIRTDKKRAMKVHPAEVAMVTELSSEASDQIRAVTDQMAVKDVNED